jgi:hypothetical protein
MKELDFSNKGFSRPFGDEVTMDVQRAVDFLQELGYSIACLSNEELIELAHSVAQERHDELSDYELDLLFDDAD